MKCFELVPREECEHTSGGLVRPAGPGMQAAAEFGVSRLALPRSVLLGSVLMLWCLCLGDVSGRVAA